MEKLFLSLFFSFLADESMRNKKRVRKETFERKKKAGKEFYEDKV